MDIQGEVKQIEVYEILKFTIKQGSRTITKKYYNLLHKEKYTYTNAYNEVMLYKKIREVISNKTPFEIHIQLKNKWEIDDIDPLIDYYNTHSEKYFRAVQLDGRYEQKRALLMELKNNIKSVNDTIDYIIEIDFKL